MFTSSHSVCSLLWVHCQAFLNLRRKHCFGCSTKSSPSQLVKTGFNFLQDSYLKSTFPLLSICRRACPPAAPADQPGLSLAGRRVQRWGWVWCSAALRQWEGFEQSAPPAPLGEGAWPPRWGRAGLPVASLPQTELPLSLGRLLNVRTRN